MSTKSSTVEIGGWSYITTDELAQRLGVSAKTIWRWQKQGLLPAFVKIGRVRLYREEKPADAMTTNSLSACSRCRVRSVAKKKAIGMMITSGVGK